MQESADELPVQAGYAAWAPLYDDGNPLTALEGPAVRAWFGPLAGRRALDIGCGTGRHTLALIEAGAAEIAALDLTPEMMALARAKVAGRHSRVHWIRHALPEPLPFRNATFDLAVLGLVAEHIDDLARALREVARVLTPGGRCIVSALHPDRTAEGQRARFIDPRTGLRHPIATFHRAIEEYLAVGRTAGLRLEGEQTLVVPPELAERLPRAARYVGRNLGWIACWSRPKLS
ncbi:MAG: class I SAM-dependent methyltransferase [Isosphaeraceae bacterium]